MKSSWKIGLILAFVVLAASAAFWLANKHRVNIEKGLGEAAAARRVRAEQGDAKAESELAYMYSHGQGVPQDYSEALRWRRKAADQGYPAGEVGLAYMYLHGQGVPQDNSEALSWYRKAADTGDAYAENNLGIIYEQSGLIQQDYSEALRWYRKAADQNYPAAEYNLGNMYYYGHGMPRDVPEAYRWYYKAAAQGNENSQRLLGLRGRGTSTLGFVFLSIGALGSLGLLMSPRSSSASVWNRRRQSTAAIGFVGLCCVGLNTYALSRFSLFPSLLVANLFNFARHALTGAFLVLAASVLLSVAVPKTAKVLLEVLGTGVLVFNVLAIVFAIAHPDTWRLPPAVRLLCLADGFLVGSAIPLAVWLRRGWVNKTEDRDGDTSSDTPAKAEK